MTSWNDIKSAWSQGWKALNEQAMSAYEVAIKADPMRYVDQIKDFMSALTDSRANLDRMKARLPNPPRTEADRKILAVYQALEKRYHELAAGFYSDARPADQPSTGAIPVVVIVVAGVALGVAACAWAVAAHEYATNLREQTALADKELEARVEASKQGRTLQPTTLPEPASEQAKKKAKGVGVLLVGGLLLAAGALAVPVFLKKKGGL
ncbi:MAG: hypothetical protein ABIO70_09210 [Pseudomonadota bacterium]